MKHALAGCAFVTVMIFGFYIFDEERKALHESEHRWIFGFHVGYHLRTFSDYLAPVTSEGLREIRSDRKPPNGVVLATTSAWAVTSCSVAGAGVCLIGCSK